MSDDSTPKRSTMDKVRTTVTEAGEVVVQSGGLAVESVVQGGRRAMRRLRGDAPPAPHSSPPPARPTFRSGGRV